MLTKVSFIKQIVHYVRNVCEVYIADLFDSKFESQVLLLEHTWPWYSIFQYTIMYLKGQYFNTYLFVTN